MGTRSIVAVPTGATSFRGRYVHWDGYPTGVGEAVRAIVARDGYAAAVRVLTAEHHGWSSVDADTTAGKGSLGGGRSRVVPGYGEGYSHAEQPDEWVTSDGDDWGTEWAHVLHESGVTVYERVWNTGGGHATGMFGMGASSTEDGGHWALRGTVRYDDAEGMERLQNEVRALHEAEYAQRQS